MPGPLVLTNGTNLVLTPLSGFASLQLTPYSARGLTQTYEVITGTGGQSSGAWLRRDVNGVLRNVVDIRFRKYKSTISCRDGETPCLDNAWIGITCEVSCAFEFSYPTGGTPARPVVGGSTRVQNGVTYYRPQLLMMVTGIKVSLPEYPSVYDWSIDLEEI
jgi:hypothetical protein